MSATHPGELQDSNPIFSINAQVFEGMDKPDYRLEREADLSETVDFSCALEEQFARLLDEREVSWQYKPRTFAVEWDEEGNFVDCFTPDFYLPEHKLFIELIPRHCGESNQKARKVRLIRQQRPEIRIELLSSLRPAVLEALI